MENNNQNPAPNAGGGNNSYVNIDTFISKCRVSLINAADEDIEPLLTKRGYPKTIIDAKLAALDELQALNEKQKKEYGEQYAATENYTKEENDFHELYTGHIVFARVDFKKDIAAQTALDLMSERKRTQTGYAAQASLFYNGILNNNNYKAIMNNRGVTNAEMQAQLDAIESFPTLKAAQAKETGEAQAATKARDAAYDDLEEWFSGFKAIAIIALKDVPQLREKLGWKE